MILLSAQAFGPLSDLLTPTATPSLAKFQTPSKGKRPIHNAFVSKTEMDPIIEVPQNSLLDAIENMPEIEDLDRSHHLLIIQRLREIHPVIFKLCSGLIHLRPWKPTSFEGSRTAPVSKSTVDLPDIGTKEPPLILHDLGLYASEGELKKVFRLTKAYESSILCGASGTGKTRFMFEGLCENIGVYLTAMQDSTGIGSADIHSILEGITCHHNFSKDLKILPENQRVALAMRNGDSIKNGLRSVILCRIIIFCLVLSCPGELPEKLRAWCMVQAAPTLIEDHFLVISNILQDCKDSYVSALDQRITSIFQKLWPTQHKIIFIAIDEAQVVAKMHPQCLLSSSETDYRSVLTGILRSIRLPRCIAWLTVHPITATTGYGVQTIENLQASANSKPNLLNTIRVTGSFISQKQQMDYIQKFIDTSQWEQSEWLRLANRLWMHLRGRYRYTSAYVSELLLKLFVDPHVLLDSFIMHYTGCLPFDAVSKPVSQRMLSLSLFNSSVVAQEWLPKYVVCSFLLTGTVDCLVEEEGKKWIEFGYAHWAAPKGSTEDKNKVPIIDEPLSLMHLTYHIFQNSEEDPFAVFLGQKLGTQESKGVAMEDIIICFCSRIFKKNRTTIVRDLFEIISDDVIDDCPVKLVQKINKENKQEWAPVTLLELLPHGGNLVEVANSIESVTKWIRYGGAPFLRPYNAMGGPDLFCFMEVEAFDSDKNTQFLLGIQVKCYQAGASNGTLRKAETSKAVQSLLPKNWFSTHTSNEGKVQKKDLKTALSELQNPLFKDKPAYMGTIVAYPTPVDRQRVEEEYRQYNKRIPLAIFKNEILEGYGARDGVLQSIHKLLVGMKKNQSLKENHWHQNAFGTVMAIHEGFSSKSEAREGESDLVDPNQATHEADVSNATASNTVPSEDAITRRRPRRLTDTSQTSQDNDTTPVPSSSNRYKKPRR